MDGSSPLAHTCYMDPHRSSLPAVCQHCTNAFSKSCMEIPLGQDPFCTGLHALALLLSILHLLYACFSMASHAWSRYLRNGRILTSKSHEMTSVGKQMPVCVSITNTSLTSYSHGNATCTVLAHGIPYQVVSSMPLVIRYTYMSDSIYHQLDCHVWHKWSV